VLVKINPLVKIIAASGMNGQKETAKDGHPWVRQFLPKPYTAEAVLHALAEVLAPV